MDNRKVLNGAGIMIIMATLATWVIILWAGQTLIYMSQAEAVVNSTTNVPATLKERIYFVGYNLSTMGNGDFKGGTEEWLIYSAIISFSGLIMITIAITYMVPILSAVTERRSLSVRIASIGDSAQQMLLKNWNGRDFKALESHLNGLAQPLAKQGQMHLAYPVLHYFYHSEKNVALLPNITALDEALTILLLYVPAASRPSSQTLIPVRNALTTFLSSLIAITPSPETTEEPEHDVSELEEAGILLQRPETEVMSKLTKRRKLLRSLLHFDGWDWNEHNTPKFTSDLDAQDIFSG